MAWECIKCGHKSGTRRASSYGCNHEWLDEIEVAREKEIRKLKKQRELRKQWLETHEKTDFVQLYRKSEHEFEEFKKLLDKTEYCYAGGGRLWTKDLLSKELAKCSGKKLLILSEIEKKERNKNRLGCFIFFVALFIGYRLWFCPVYYLWFCPVY
jgi:hypothetical protein